MDSSGSVVKNLLCNAGNVGSIPGWGTKIPTCQGAANPMHHDQSTAHDKDPAWYKLDSIWPKKEMIFFKKENVCGLLQATHS